MRRKDFVINEGDNIAGRFKVTDNVADSIFNDNADAASFNAIDINNNANYTAVFFKKIELYNLENIVKLMNFNENNIVKPEAIEIYRVNNYEFLVSVFQNPDESYKPIYQCNSSIDLESIILQLAKVISEIHKIGIMHGNINSNSILLKDNQILLKEFISFPCGSKQHTLFETINRTRIHNYSKEENELKADYYALGVLIFSIIYSSSKGSDSILSIPSNDIIANKLKFGSYEYLCNELLPIEKQNPKIAYLLFWLLHDDEEQRWGYEGIVSFLSNKQDLNQLSEFLLESKEKIYINHFSSPIAFLNSEYSSPKELSFVLRNNFQEALLWCTNSNILKQLIEYSSNINYNMTFTLFSINSQIKSDSTKAEYYLISLLLLLDSESPIPLSDNISFEINGFARLLKYAVVTNNQELIYSLMKIISILKELAETNVISITYLNTLITEEDPLILMQKLNPNMVYRYSLHPSGSRLYISTPDVLDIFDNLEQNNMDEIYFPSNFYNFIELNLSDIPAISAYCTLESLIKSNKEIKILSLFAYIQEKYEIVDLNNLCSKFVNSLKDKVLDYIHSHYAKEKLSLLFDETIKSGNLFEILKILDSKYIKKDHELYSKTLGYYNSMKNKYLTYSTYISNPELLDQKGDAMALRVGYTALVFCALWLIFKLISFNG